MIETGPKLGLILCLQSRSARHRPASEDPEGPLVIDVVWITFMAGAGLGAGGRGAELGAAAHDAGGTRPVPAVRPAAGVPQACSKRCWKASRPRYSTSGAVRSGFARGIIAVVEGSAATQRRWIRTERITDGCSGAVLSRKCDGNLHGILAVGSVSTSRYDMRLHLRAIDYLSVSEKKLKWRHERYATGGRAC